MKFDLEKLLKAVHLRYLQDGRADVRKVNHRRDRENEFPDFIGAIKGGRAVAIEAKSTESDNWQWSEVKAHQRAYLASIGGMGGVAFVYLWRRGDHYVIPWDRIGRGKFKPEAYWDCLLLPGASWLDRFAQGELFR